MTYRTMRLRALRWLAKLVADPRDPYIRFDRHGVAHFDVAAYLSSPEGSRRLDDVSSAGGRR